MIELVLDVLSVTLLALGLAVMTITVYGVVRLRGLYPRLQAAGKGPMLGTVAILAASLGTGEGDTIVRSVVVALFLLLTTPVASHVIAKAAYRRERAGNAARPDEGEG